MMSVPPEHLPDPRVQLLYDVELHSHPTQVPLYENGQRSADSSQYSELPQSSLSNESETFFDLSGGIFFP